MSQDSPARHLFQVATASLVLSGFVLIGCQESGNVTAPAAPSGSQTQTPVVTDNPEAVKIDLVDTEKGQTININCEKKDIGKVIGKNGKTIMSIRSLVAGAASRMNRQINVEVVDKVEG